MFMNIGNVPLATQKDEDTILCASSLQGETFMQLALFWSMNQRLSRHKGTARFVSIPVLSRGNLHFARRGELEGCMPDQFPFWELGLRLQDTFDSRQESGLFGLMVFLLRELDYRTNESLLNHIPVVGAPRRYCTEGRPAKADQPVVTLVISCRVYD